MGDLFDLRGPTTAGDADESNIGLMKIAAKDGVGNDWIELETNTYFSDFIAGEMLENIESVYITPNYRSTVYLLRTNTASNTAVRAPGLLQAATILPVRAQPSLGPVVLDHTSPAGAGDNPTVVGGGGEGGRVTIVDVGKNIAGVCSFAFSGPAGAEITVRALPTCRHSSFL